ncbi:RHS repeat-associated core domain-containing protein [Chloroflexota bacterium]
MRAISTVCYSTTRSGSVPTDKKFTGQRLDGTGLYYYGARYYDPTIGRFISADTFVPWSTGVDVVSSPLSVNGIPQGLGNVLAPQGNYPVSTLEAPMNPQSLNRYSYVLNNPLRYTDPTGYYDLVKAIAGAVILVVVDVLVVGPMVVATAIFQPEALPIVLKVAECVAIPATALGVYLIVEGLSDTEDTEDSNAPQLPLDKSDEEQPVKSPSTPDTESDGPPSSSTDQEPEPDPWWDYWDEW